MYQVECALVEQALVTRLQWRSQNEAEEAIPPRNKLANIFTGALYQFSTVGKYTERTVGLKMTSVTDDVIDWPLPHKILG